MFQTADRRASGSVRDWPQADEHFSKQPPSKAGLMGFTDVGPNINVIG